MRNVWKRAAFALLLVLGMAAGGVVSAQMGGEEPKKEEPKEEPKSIDPPFKIEEVKKTITKGLKLKYKTNTSPTAEMKCKGWMTLEVLELTEKGFKYKMTTKTDELNGKKTEGEMAEESSSEDERLWDNYWRTHELKEGISKYSDEKIKVGAGEFDCKLLTESHGNAESIKMTVKTWYIKNKPGLFAKMELTVEEVNEGKKTTHTDTYELEELK